MTTKPDLTRVWAAGAPGANVVDPDTTTPGKFDDGWLAEVPPFEHFNFLQQLFTQGLAHFNEFGIGEWDTDTEYPLGGMSSVAGKSYTSIVASNQGNDPTSSPTKWLESGAGKQVTTSTTDNTFERLLKVGDFGFGASAIEKTDFDLVIETGFYFINNPAINPPLVGSLNWNLLVFRGANANNLIQIAISRSNNAALFRVSNEGVYNDWQTLYSNNTILGTVSESGGIPTGAIIEQGSNANGTYTKFADGTLVCRINFTVSSNPTTWTFPHAFLGGASSTISGAANNSASSLVSFSSNTGPTVDVHLYTSAGAATTGPCYLTANGRWY